MFALDPMDSVQKRSRTTCAGWLARFIGTDAIHAVSPVPHHSEIEQDSSAKLEYQSSDSLDWLFLSSEGGSEAEKPD